MMATIKVKAVNKQIAHGPLQKFDLLLGLSQREGKHKPSPVIEITNRPKVDDNKEPKGDDGVKTIAGQVNSVDTPVKIKASEQCELEQDIERALSECVAEALDKLSDDDADADATSAVKSFPWSLHRCTDT